MNYYLFVDNFRGFRDTCVPIADVNFFVGENSTGKTSLLSLLKMFSGSNFLMGRGIEDEDVSFRRFSDMVTIDASDHSYFHIGFAAETPPTKNSGKATTGWLFTFRDIQGRPRVSKCTFCRNGEKLTLRFGTSVLYKRSACSTSLTPEQVMSAMRSDWVREHARRKPTGYQKLETPRGFGGEPLPILFALSLISQKAKKRGEPVFSFPDIGFAPPPLTWFAPIRSEPKRTYDELVLEFSPQGQHTPYLIRQMLKSKKQKAKLKDFIESSGKATGLFRDVTIQNFGRGPSSRFELDIVIDDNKFNILHVGYGVSQALPIMVEFLAENPGTCFAVQEPEIHLHPRAQAALGDIIFEMSVKDHKRFLVETHSDFMIDRFRMNYRKERARKPVGQVLFFERRDKHNMVTALSIGPSGDFPKDQPDSYRQFFVREQMNLLGM
jgi:hypothetical protein